MKILLLFYSLHFGILRKCFRVFKRNMLPLCLMVAHLFTDVAAVSYSSEVAYVLIALCFAMMISGFTGASVPMCFYRFGIDPAIASGPLITTINDLVAVLRKG